MSNAIAVISKANQAGALIFSAQHLETPPLYKAEATLIHVEPRDFHDIQGKLVARKETTDRISDAAGIDFINLPTSLVVKIEPAEPALDLPQRTVFTAYAQGRVRLSDGSWRLSTVEPYCFDYVARATAEEPVDVQKRKKKMIEYYKAGPARAATGARLRVIRQLTGMPTAFDKGQIGQGKDLAFSRIVQNTDYILGTKEGRMMAIAAATGVAGMLYGPQAGQQSAPQSQVVEPEYEETELRPADDQQTASMAAQALDDGFELEPPPKVDPAYQSARNTIIDYINSGTLNTTAEAKLQGFINDPTTPIETMHDYIGKLKAGLGLKKVAS